MQGAEKWPVARLIPISSASGVEAQERRLASATLAVMSAVPEFGRAMLKPLGAPAGRIETFIEVPLKLNNRSFRPDGVILVTRGTKQWGALLEAKTAKNPLDEKQLDDYLDLARQLEFDAVITISNQYVTSSSEYPVEVNRRKLRRLKLHHWSWSNVLTEAIVQKEHRGVSDPDQAYILGELIHYISDERSGAMKFEGMGGDWTGVRDGARERTLRKGDPAVASVVARWDDLIRYLALNLTAELGSQVTQVLPAPERTTAGRRHALTDGLVQRGQLHAELQIPGAAATLTLLADLRSRQVIASTSLGAPAEGTSRGRVSWLLRQIPEAPDNLKVEARLKGTRATMASQIGVVREDPAVLYPARGKEIRGFVLSLTADMGVKRGTGRGGFGDSVIAAATDFYASILQNLTPWKPAAPKLRKPLPEEEPPIAVMPAPLPEPEEAPRDTLGEPPEETADRATQSWESPEPEGKESESGGQDAASVMPDTGGDEGFVDGMH